MAEILSNSPAFDLASCPARCRGGNEIKLKEMHESCLAEPLYQHKPTHGSGKKQLFPVAWGVEVPRGTEIHNKFELGARSM